MLEKNLSGFQSPKTEPRFAVKGCVIRTKKKNAHLLVKVVLVGVVGQSHQQVRDDPNLVEQPRLVKLLEAAVAHAPRDAPPSDLPRVYGLGRSRLRMGRGRNSTAHRQMSPNVFAETTPKIRFFVDLRNSSTLAKTIVPSWTTLANFILGFCVYRLVYRYEFFCFFLCFAVSRLNGGKK